MAFCAWCGNPVHEVSYAPCPRCGNPTNGAQRVAGAGAGAKTTAIILAVVVGGLVLLGVIGIVAAIAIPNFLTAKQRAMQKRTMAEMRSVATAVEAYAVDKNAYPEGSSVSDLASALSPDYIRDLPSADAWGTPMRYAVVDDTFVIASAGADKQFEHDSLDQYGPDTKTSKFDNDIVFRKDRFVQYPEGAQTGGGD